MAQTSDWAQQEEEEENMSWDNQNIEGSVYGEESFDGGSEEEEYREPPEEAKLFVGNLRYDIDSESLAQLFNQAGVVEISEVQSLCFFFNFLTVGRDFIFLVSYKGF